MELPRETLFTDVDLLRELACAREAVDSRGSGGGRLEWLAALENEIDRRLRSRRARASA